MPRLRGGNPRNGGRAQSTLSPGDEHHYRVPAKARSKAQREYSPRLGSDSTGGQRALATDLLRRSRVLTQDSVVASLGRLNIGHLTNAELGTNLIGQLLAADLERVEAGEKPTMSVHNIIQASKAAMDSALNIIALQRATSTPDEAGAAMLGLESRVAELAKASAALERRLATARSTGDIVDVTPEGDA